jgi:hypothetical protein
MRDWQWQEIVQHPERRLTLGQIELLRAQNIAALSCERRSALCGRLIIEIGRLHEAQGPPHNFGCRAFVTGHLSDCNCEGGQRLSLTEQQPEFPT